MLAGRATRVARWPFPRMEWMIGNPPGPGPLASKWTNRVPAMDLPLRMLIPHGGEPPCHLQIDRLPDGRYRATAGPLPEGHELCRTPDRESLLRHADCLRACRSFREVLTALQQLSELDGGRDATTTSQRRCGGGRSADGSGQLKLRPAAA